MTEHLEPGSRAGEAHGCTTPQSGGVATDAAEPASPRGLPCVSAGVAPEGVGARTTPTPEQIASIVAGRPNFTPPLRATRHCRHYSYAPGLGGGPRCARGLDPATTLPCMPEPRESCAQREDYTDDERAAWKAAVDARMARLRAAVQALPAPIPLRTGGYVDCPNCGGRLRYDRWHRGASIECETEWCCGARFNIEAGADWPVRAHLQKGAS